MSNSPIMLKELAIKCDGSHQHQHLTENRAKACENYPLELIQAILRGITKTADAKEAIMDMNSSAWNMTLHLHSANGGMNEGTDGRGATLPSSVLSCDDGTEIPIMFDAQHFKPVYRDEYTGEPLPWDLVRTAMAEELAYFNEVVWEATDKSTAQATDD